MFTISIKHDFDRFAATLDRLQREQLPFAVARALTDTARAAQQQVTADLPAIFDRPNPFTMRSLTFIAARKDRMFAVVTVRDIQAKYLLPEEVGGERTPAMATRRPGRALTEPGPQLNRDQYGGIPIGTVRRLLRQAKAAAERATQQRHAARQAAGRGVRAVAARDRGVFYVGPQGHGHLKLGGIYQRLPGHRLTHLIAFASTAHYHARFHFRERVEAACVQAFLPAMERRFAEAIASAR